MRVVAAPTTHTCFVDGGAPERSLLVPGDGAPAPYDLEDREALVADDPRARHSGPDPDRRLAGAGALPRMSRVIACSFEPQGTPQEKPWVCSTS